jgi:hypothetical protein
MVLPLLIELVVAGRKQRVDAWLEPQLPIDIDVAS